MIGMKAKWGYWQTWSYCRSCSRPTLLVRRRETGKNSCQQQYDRPLGDVILWAPVEHGGGRRGQNTNICDQCWPKLSVDQQVRAVSTDDMSMAIGFQTAVEMIRDGDTERDGWEIKISPADPFADDVLSENAVSGPDPA